MKTEFSVAIFLPLLVALSCTNSIRAQTFTTLHAFTGGLDGASPEGRLFPSGNTLYGTTYAQSTGGFWSAQGTVFSVKIDGTGFTTLHTFYPSLNNSDGFGPEAGLVFSGNTLYGTTCYGGSSDAGTIFAVNTDGGQYRILHSFWSLSEGMGPNAELVLSDTTLYGTAYVGGSSGDGTLFTLLTDGTGFTNLHNCNRNEGQGPSTVILLGSRLYGTTFTAGPSGNGSVFAVNADGTVFTNLHSFTAFSGSRTNGDGANPYAGLVLSDGFLYGTTSSGGSSGNGTVFAVSTDGTVFRNLHSFTALSGSRTNSDGADSRAGLILSGNTLYGTTSRGGSSGNGTLFAVSTDGTGFICLYNFTALSRGTNGDGANPNAGLTKSGNALYGATPYGGNFGNGTIFSISFPPKLKITLLGEDVVLTWPTNYVGFDYTTYTLQSTTDPGLLIWSTNFPAPIVVNGQHTVTNPISGPRRFYRLASQ